MKDYLVIFRVGVRVQAESKEQAAEIAGKESLNENVFEEIQEVKEVVV